LYYIAKSSTAMTHYLLWTRL